MICVDNNGTPDSSWATGAV